MTTTHRTRTWKVGFTVSAVAVLGVLAWLATKAPASISEPSGPKAPSAGFADHPLPTAASFPVTPSMAQPVVESDLLRSLYASDNLARFVSDALQKPEQGGVYFAIKAIQLCAMPAEDPSDQRPLGAAQTRARALMQSRCAGLNQALRTDGTRDHGLDRIQDLEKGPLAQRDPLIQARSKLYQAALDGEPAAKRADGLKALLSGGGAGLLLGELQQLDVQQRVFLNGEQFGGVPRLAFQRALMIYRMERSIASGASDGGNYALALCAMNGNCEGDAFARVLGPNDPAVHDPIRRVYPSLRDALNRADVGAFAVPEAASRS